MKEHWKSNPKFEVCNGDIREIRLVHDEGGTSILTIDIDNRGEENTIVLIHGMSEPATDAIAKQIGGESRILWENQP